MRNHYFHSSVTSYCARHFWLVVWQLTVTSDCARHFWLVVVQLTVTLQCDRHFWLVHIFLNFKIVFTPCFLSVYSLLGWLARLCTRCIAFLLVITSMASARDLSNMDGQDAQPLSERDLCLLCTRLRAWLRTFRTACWNNLHLMCIMSAGTQNAHTIDRLGTRSSVREH